MLNGEPFRAHEARRRISEILRKGVVYSELPHFQNRLKEREITMVDVTNVLRAGQVQEAEMDNGAWRYQVTTAKYCVVVEFTDEDEITLITAYKWGSK